MNVVTAHLPHALVVTLDGEIDLANADGHRAALAAAAEQHEPACLVLDLRPVSYLDSAGVELLFRLGAEIAPKLSVVIAPDSVPARVLGIVSLGELCAVHATVDAALEACAAQA